MINKLFALVVVLSMSLVTLPFLAEQRAEALSGSQFRAGRIIDDSLFFDGSAMSKSQVQSFLNAKVPDCDSNGDIMHSSGQTRKQYAASKGVSTPFICLKNFKQNTPSRPSESGLCSGLSAKSNRTAAEIIDDVAKACSVSQKAILVLLQKEQSLITDDWPWPVQYRTATGYGCPDSTGCESEYYGFFNQVYLAARQFKRYAADPTHYNHRPGLYNNIWYQADNPSTPHQNERTQCGNSSVFIENQATAGLYNYTPYQPNQAALNNLYGTGNSCSAYGNRNFWRYYNDWFGPSTFAFNPSVNVIQGITLSDSTPGEGQNVTVTVKIKNFGDTEAAIGLFAVAVRGPDGTNFDFGPANNLILDPGETYTYTRTRSFPKVGIYSIRTSNYRPGHGWQVYYPVNASGGIVRDTTLTVHKASVTVNSGLELSKSSLGVGQDVSATFTARNYDSYPVNIGKMAVVVRGPNGTNFDFSPDNDVVIDPGETYTYSKTRSFPVSGTYTARTANFRPGFGWATYYPVNVSGGINREINFNVSSLSVGVTHGLNFSPTTISAGQLVTATFKAKNYGSYPANIGKMAVVVRGPNGTNFDFSPDNDVVIDPGETYTYSKTRSFPVSGTYTARTANFRPGFGWATYYPVNVSGGIAREISFTIN